MQTKPDKSLSDLKRQLFWGTLDKRAVTGIFLTVMVLFMILLVSLFSGEQGGHLFMALLKGGALYLFLSLGYLMITFGKKTSEVPWLMMPSGKKIRDLSRTLTQLNEVARRDGIAELEPEKLTQDPWLRHHLKLIIEGMDPLDLERVLRAQYDVLISGLQASVAKATRISLGLRAIGFLTALWVYSLQTQSPAIAVLWFFFSECVYHLILKEWVRRLDAQSETVTLWHQVVHEGLVGIARGAAPSALSEILQTLLLKL